MTTNDRELRAVMAAILMAGYFANPNSDIDDCSDARLAECALDTIDAILQRLQARDDE